MELEPEPGLEMQPELEPGSVQTRAKMGPKEGKSEGVTNISE